MNYSQYDIWLRLPAPCDGDVKTQRLIS